MSVQAIPNGIYLIANYLTKTVLGITSQDSPSGTFYRIVGQVTNGQDNQAWKVTRDATSGFYTLQNLKMSTLYASGSDLNSGSYLGYPTLQGFPDSWNWQLGPGSQNGAYYIQSVKAVGSISAPCVMDLANASATDGNPVIITTQSAKPVCANQQWCFSQIG